MPWSKTSSKKVSKPFKEQLRPSLEFWWDVPGVRTSSGTVTAKQGPHLKHLTFTAPKLSSKNKRM